MRATEIDELVRLRRARPRLMRAISSSITRPCGRLKELIDAGELGECSASTETAEPRDRADEENALWSLGVHDLS